MPKRRGRLMLATLAMILGMLASPIGAAAVAYPHGYVTFHYTQCTGPAGTPSTFEARGLNHGLHLVDGSGIWILTEIVVVETGLVVFTTPGFEHNELAVTCQIISPIFGDLRQVTGHFAPRR